MARVAELSELDLEAIQALIERCHEYYVLTTGRRPPPEAARRVWDALPEGGFERSAKLTLGLFEGGLVGQADIVRDWPRSGTWLIGLLLVDPAVRRRGTGTSAVTEVDARAAQAGADTLRVTVVDENPGGLAFWERLGFTRVAPVGSSTATALERPVAALGMTAVDPTVPALPRAVMSP